MIQHFLLTFYANLNADQKYQSRIKRVIEASDAVEAGLLASKIVNKEGIRYDPYHLKLIPADQVALEKKRIKDTRKLRYNPNTY